jgi:zinc transport system permease protein
MLEIFQYSFMVRAFIAGTIIGIIAPLIGSFLVTRRYALMADSLSHIALSGIAIGLLVGIYPIYVALLVTVISAIVIEYLRTKRKISGEIALAMFLYGGLATAIILISLARGFNVDLFSYLFGSITTVRPIDLWVIGSLGLAVIVAVYFLYDELLYISFNEEAARVSGIPVNILNTVLVILTAITVSLSMRIVGLLLIGALLVIPVVAAMQVGRSFVKTLFYAVGFGVISVISGLFVSYYLNLAAGGTIVAISLGLFGVSAIIRLKKQV